MYFGTNIFSYLLTFMISFHPKNMTSKLAKPPSPLVQFHLLFGYPPPPSLCGRHMYMAPNGKIYLKCCWELLLVSDKVNTLLFIFNLSRDTLTNRLSEQL